ITNTCPYFWYLSVFQPLFCIGDFGCIMSMTYSVFKLEKLLRFMKNYCGEIRHLSSFALYANDKQNATRHNLTIQRQIFKQAPPKQHNDEKDHYEKFFNHLGLEEFFLIFMVFLFSEFCQENLLGQQQSKKTTKKKLWSQCFQLLNLRNLKILWWSKMKTVKIYTIILPPEIVKSEIVFDTDLTPRQNFKFLVEKYVVSNAPYCLNLSYQQQSHILSNYKKKSGEELSLQEMCSMFDSCLRELLSLLRNSFGRFALTDMYKKMCTL
ncbi:hypothetical protein RFI_33762, partial [Reticulomyxa filosa]